MAKKTETAAKKPRKTIVQNAPDETGTVDAAAMKRPGFLLDTDDPFAEGTARVYTKAKGMDSARLPLVLPYDDAGTKAALESYIVRAAGGGDNERAGKARAALEKIKS